MQVIEKSDAVDLKNVSGEVKFCNISFQYGQESPSILNGLNLHIKPGETVALVGPSGGGKTTLAKLILRLYNPSGGEFLYSRRIIISNINIFLSRHLIFFFCITGSIFIDNQNISDIRLGSLRSHVGLVSQDVVSNGNFYSTLCEDNCFFLF